MEDSKIEKLARAGGLCSRCGGLHTAEIEHAILGELVGLPLCECEDCRICERLRRAIEALEREEDDTSGGQGELWQTP